MRLSAEERWGPTLILCGQSLRKTLGQRQMECGRPRLFHFISLLAVIVLNTDEKSRWVKVVEVW